MLERSRLSIEQASARDLAKKEIWPDLVFGVQYGQRPGDMGTERMGSAMVGFSQPIFASRRQLRLRDETAAMEQMARAQLTEMQRRSTHASASCSRTSNATARSFCCTGPMYCHMQRRTWSPRSPRTASEALTS